MRYLLRLAIAIVLVIGSPETAGAAEPAAAVDLAEAARFRAEHGLVADIATIEQIAAASPISEFGVPLTPDEEDGIISRNAMLDRSIGLVEAVSAEPQLFAGLRLAHTEGGYIEVYVKGPGLSKRDEVRSKAPADVPVRFTAVQYSQAELDAVVSQIVADIDTLAVEGIEVAEVGVHTIGNNVNVAVADLRPDTLSILAERYGPMLSVVEATVQDVACTRTDCSPLRGGIYIFSASMGCTLGFMARSTVNSDKFALTSGHCGSAQWYHFNYSTVIGTTVSNSLNLGSPRSDSQKIGAWGSRAYSPWNRVYVSANDQSRQMTATRGRAWHSVGQTVCSSGASNGYRCGQIVDLDQWHAPGGKGMFSTKASFLSSGGDSGGPVFQSNNAYGLVSQASASATLFNPIDYVMGDLGIRLCLNDACS